MNELWLDEKCLSSSITKTALKKNKTVTRGYTAVLLSRLSNLGHTFKTFNYFSVLISTEFPHNALHHLSLQSQFLFPIPILNHLLLKNIFLLVLPKMNLFAATFLLHGTLLPRFPHQPFRQTKRKENQVLKPFLLG